jgi:hypothetical protein
MFGDLALDLGDVDKARISIRDVAMENTLNHLAQENLDLMSNMVDVTLKKRANERGMEAAISYANSCLNLMQQIKSECSEWKRKAIYLQQMISECDEWKRKAIYLEQKIISTKHTNLSSVSRCDSPDSRCCDDLCDSDEDTSSENE